MYNSCCTDAAGICTHGKLLFHFLNYYLYVSSSPGRASPLIRRTRMMSLGITCNDFISQPPRGKGKGKGGFALCSQGQAGDRLRFLLGDESLSNVEQKALCRGFENFFAGLF